MKFLLMSFAGFSRKPVPIFFAVGFAIGLLTATVHAESTLPIPDLCPGESACTPEMRSIFEEFLSVGTLPDMEALPQVFSGACYYDGYGVDPSDLNYGVSLIDRDGQAVTFEGEFAFFANPNPYADLDVVRAREYFKAKGSVATPMTIAADFLGVQYETEQTLIRYWLRQNPNTGDLLLVQFGTYDNSRTSMTRIFCRMARNSNPT